MQYFIHQTPSEIRLVTVSDIPDGKVHAQMKGFRIVTGTPETWEKDEKIPASFPNRLLKQGYVAITETQYQHHLETAHTTLSDQAQAPLTTACNIVPWETIKAQFAPSFFNDADEYLDTPALRNFCVYPGDTVIDGDLVIDFSELATTAQTAGRNIVVNGNLTINGNFDGSRDIETLPQFIYITGNLTARHLLLSGWLDMIVAGNVTITGTVFGYYGEPGGRLLIKGNLTTEHLLNGFMYPIKVAGSTHGTCYSFNPIDGVEGFEAAHLKSNFTGEDDLTQYPLETAVIPYDPDLKEYSFSFEKAVELLRKDQPIFKIHKHH